MSKPLKVGTARVFPGFKLRFIFLALCLALRAQAASRLPLDGAWMINSTAEVHDSGEVISKASYAPENWYRAKVPATVMAALVDDNVLEDPNFGMNLRSSPGVSYPSGFNFAKVPMPPSSPYLNPWWFRTTFSVTGQSGKRALLHFDGINFRANIWLNGKQIATAQQVAGMWRLYAFDVTDALEYTKTNTLAVEVSPPTPHDLANTFVDWNPMPPDKNMGIWRSVYLTFGGDVAIEYPHVITKLDASLDAAHLTVWADLHNYSKQSVSGVLKGTVAGVAISQAVSIDAGATKAVKFAPVDIAHPKLWWPLDLGEPHLEDLHLEFGTDSSSDSKFGIREISSELLPQPPQIAGGKDGIPRSNRLFRVNGQKILIRGGGYTFDMLLRTDATRQAQELDYVADMHLNAVRLEGKLEDENFFNLADEKGILVMAGWSCCDHWEQWNQWNAEDHAIADASLLDQIRRLRGHASLLAWLNGSDNPPPAEQEEKYISILQELHWPNPHISSAQSKATKVSGESGVKMLGPYEYVAPSYWLEAHSLGGAYGFNTETSPGPDPPPVESLKRMLGTDHLWPVDSWWSYHAGGGVFRTLNIFNEAMNKRYGAPADVDEYAMKAQVLAYEGERAMFEAFGRNKYVATGVIQWMLNNAWPSLIWHLYDYYLRPGGSYFGAKKACEPLHIQYSYDDKSVVVVNSFRSEFKALVAKAEVYNLDLTPKFSKEAAVDSGADSSTRAFSIPDISGLSTTYFVRLTLTRDNAIVSRNFYWLSTQPDVMDLAKSNYFVTPTKTFADMRALNTLPKVRVTATITAQKNGAQVTVENTGTALAFFVRLKILTGDEEVLPVLWEDNYIALMPGEKRTLTARFQPKKPVTLAVSGWNVDF